MAEIIGACGLVCSECPAYLATQADDAARVAAVAAQWSKDYGGDIKPADVWCDGCMELGARKCGHTKECDVRACVTERRLANCAPCGDYGCAKMTAFVNMAPAAKETLERLRRG